MAVMDRTSRFPAVVASCCLLLILAVASLSVVSADTVRVRVVRLASAPWSVRKNAVAARVGDRIVMVGSDGGSSVLTPLNDVHSFDVATQTWTAHGNAPFTPRWSGGLIGLNASATAAAAASVLLLGGRSGYNQFTATQLLGTGASPPQWSPQADLPFGIADFGLVEWRGMRWLIGGATASGLSNDVWTQSEVGAWTLRANAQFTPRYGHGCVVYRDAIYVLGGSDSMNHLNDVWRLSDPDGSWTQLAPMSCSPRGWTAHGVLGDRIVVVGGVSVAHDGVCVFDGTTWSAEQSSIARIDQAAFAVANDTLFIMGGRDCVIGCGYSSSSVFAVSLEPIIIPPVPLFVHVTQLGAGSFSPRYGAAAAVAGGRILLAAGYDSSQTSYLNDVHSLDDVTLTWTDHGNAPCPPRANAAMIAVDSPLQSNVSVLLVGGYRQFIPSPDQWLTSSFPPEWSAQANMPTARADFGLVQWRGLRWILGGTSNDGTSNEVWAQSEVGTWAQQANAQFSPRYAFGCVVYRDAIYVLGGFDSTNVLNEVWRLSDLAGNWTQLAPMSCSPRRDAAVGVVSDRIVVVTGQGAAFGTLGTLRSDLCLFNGNRNEWSVPEPAPLTRAQAASVVRNNTLYILGGMSPLSFRTNTVFALTLTPEPNPTAQSSTAGNAPSSSSSSSSGRAVVAVSSTGSGAPAAASSTGSPAVCAPVSSFIGVGPNSVRVSELCTPSFSPRWGSAAAVVGGRILLAAGYGDPNVFNDVHSFDPATQVWTDHGNAPFAPRAGGALLAVSSSTSALLVGGINYRAPAFLSDQWLSSGASPPQWSAQPNLPSDRSFFRLVEWRARRWGVVGLAYFLPITSSQMWSQSIEGGAWIARNDAPFGPSVGCVVYKDAIYAIGGAYWNYASGLIANNDVWRLSDPNGAWTQLAPMSCSPRSGAAVGVISDRIVVVGGQSESATAGSSVLSDMCVFDGVGWSAPESVPMRRAEAAAVSIDNTLYILGGRSSDNVKSNSVFALTITLRPSSLSSTGSSVPSAASSTGGVAPGSDIGGWTPAPEVPLIPVQDSASAANVLDGTAVVLFGGRSNASMPNAGFLGQAYLFDGSIWTVLTPLSAAVAPSARAYASIVGVGPRSVMLIGGEARFFFLRDVWIGTLMGGGVISWTAKPDAPWSVRKSATAVLFNQRVWFMGGQGTDGSVFNEVYSASIADASVWRQETTPGWSPRIGFGAVVFKSSLFVFGGELASSFTNDVWRLANPTAQWHELNPMSIAPRAWFSFGALESQIIVGFGVGAAAASTVQNRPTMRALAQAPTSTHLTDWTAFDGESWAASIDAGVTRSRSTGNMPRSNGTMMIIGGDSASGLTNSVLLFKASSHPTAAAAAASESNSASALPWIIVGVAVAVALLLIVACVCLHRSKSAHGVRQKSGVVEMCAPVPQMDVPDLEPDVPDLEPDVIIESAVYPAVRVHMGAEVQVHSPMPSPSLDGAAPFAMEDPLDPMSIEPAFLEAEPLPVPTHIASETNNRVHAELFWIVEALAAFALTPAQQSHAQALVSQLHNIVAELMAMPREVGVECASGAGMSPCSPGPAFVQHIDPAVKLGSLMEIGDQIVAIEGVPVQSAEHASFLLGQSMLVLPGQTAELDLLRGSADSLAPRVPVQASLVVQAAHVHAAEVHARILLLQECLQGLRDMRAECDGQAQ